MSAETKSPQGPLAHHRLAGLWTVSIVAVVVALMTHLSLRFQIARLGYELADARREHAHLLENERLLRTERATLLAPNRIRTLAQMNLGMREPGPHDIVNLDQRRQEASGRAR